MDFPIPICRFCGNELLFISINLDIQKYTCQTHYSSYSVIIPVSYYFYIDVDILRLSNIKVDLNINQSIFTWTVFDFEYCDTLHNESGLVWGLIRNNELITAQDFFASFYHDSKGSPEQMERELKSFNG